MRPEVERAIAHFYPRRALVSPWEDPSVVWSYDPKGVISKAIVRDLESLDPGTRPGTRGEYDLSEELEIGAIRLQLSYLGPFAALDYRLAVEVDLDGHPLDRRAGDVRRILERHDTLVLSTGELEERADWIRNHATVWDCLFVLGDRSG